MSLCGCVENQRCVLHIAFSKLDYLEKELAELKQKHQSLQNAFHEQMVEKERLGIQLSTVQSSFLAQLSKK
jgi:hypothetical protein